ncbi:MAG TPA: DUF2238 domain-containing protein [Actinomycetota bacterium]|nr:DUF2238 domain-containing protein [Actinomycetota bacterium]
MKSVLLLVRTHPWFTAFSVGYAVLLSAYGYGEFPVRTLTYAVIVVLDFVVVAAVNRRVNLPGWVLWGLSIWGLLHMVGGLVAWEPSENGIVYGIWLVPGVLRYDQLTHLFGFGMGTAACWYPLHVRTREWDAPGAKALMASLMGMGLGALNEVVEFASIYAVPEQQVGGLENTGWDLIFNLMGAVLMGLALWRFGASAEPGAISSGAEPGRPRRPRSSSSA